MSPRVIPKTPAPAEQRRQELAEANARIEGAFRQGADGADTPRCDCELKEVPGLVV